MAKTKSEVIITNNSVADFGGILSIIETARAKAYRAVNKELIDMYWEIGEYVNKQVKSGVWGDGIIDDLSAFLTLQNPNKSGFSPRNLRRMRQFYETYQDRAFWSPLVSKIALSKEGIE